LLGSQVTGSGTVLKLFVFSSVAWLEAAECEQIWQFSVRKAGLARHRAKIFSRWSRQQEKRRCGRPVGETTLRPTLQGRLLAGANAT